MKTRTLALAAGCCYLALFFLAIFANFLVLGSLLVPGDEAATASAVDASPGLLRAGIAAFLTVFALDVVIAWALYYLFKPVHESLSLLSAWLRLLYTVFLGAAVVPLALLLDSDLSSLALFDAFNYTWLAGLFLFGLHLIVLGWLLNRSGWTHRLLGALLIVAGLAYMTDTLAHILIENYNAYADAFLAMVAVPSIAGEFWLTLWLLLKGGRVTSTPTSSAR